MTLRAHDLAIADGMRRAFTKRAASLRGDAATMTTTITDKQGRVVVITSPEAVVKTRTAAMLDECAADVAAMFTL